MLCALAAIGGCKDKDKGKDDGKDDKKEERGGKTSKLPPPPTSSAVLDEEPAPVEAPPPEAGYVRIAAQAIDVKGIRAGNDSWRAGVETGGDCAVIIATDRPAVDVDTYLAALGTKKVLKKETTPDGWILHYTSEGSPDTKLVISGKAGDRRYLCESILDGKKTGAEKCAEQTCASIKAVPEAAPARPRPETAPLVETGSGGGIDGESRGGVNIWADGTIHYHGPKCKERRGRTGKVDAARVTELIDVLKKGGFLGLDEDQGSECCDCVGVSMTATVDGKKHRVGQTSCEGQLNEPFGSMLAWVFATAGKNPCQY